MRHVFLTAAVLSAAGLLALPSPSRGEDRRAREKREQRQREETRRREEERLRAEQIRLGLYPTSQPTSQPSTHPSTYTPPPPVPRQPVPRQPAAGAGQQGDRRTAAQKMQDVLRQQEMVKRAMRDEVMNQANAARPGGTAEVPLPLTPAEQVAEAQRKLDEETARHGNRLAELRRDEAGAKAAGDKKRAQRARKDIESENDSHARTSANLRRQLHESQARLDGEVSR